MRFYRAMVIVFGILVLSGCTGPNSKHYMNTDLKSGSAGAAQIGLEDIDGVIDQDLSLFRGDRLAMSDSSAGVKSEKQNVISDGMYEISSMQMLNVEISNKGYTRFSIEGERIEDVFVFPQEELQVSIHRQGYLLVLPKAATLSAASSESTSTPVIYMTITGDEGTTQDMSLRLTGKAPQPVKFVKVNLE